MKTVAVVLAGGSGSRMKSSVKKQYLPLGGKPVIWYALQVFEQCSRIDEIVLVCGHGETERCREQIVEQFGFRKVSALVEGGKERYHSVHAGLRAIGSCDYVLIHDGARPFIDQEMLERILEELPASGACVAGMPVKDTIKVRGENGFVEQTLPREKLWQIQTPQAFAYPMIRAAYEKMIDIEKKGMLTAHITDDAMVAEVIAHHPVKLVEGSYENIKITTPDDLPRAEAILVSFSKPEHTFPDNRELER